MSLSDAIARETRDDMTDTESRHAGINEYELRQIVDVATSYLETGLFDDADDLLQEVLEAGTFSPEIEDLIRRIEEARGLPGASGELASEFSPRARRRILVHLTSPLPGSERLPRPVQRLIAETERDFNEGRRHSALDLCHVVTAQAPDFIPNYLRTAQVRLALGDEDGACKLIATVERLYALDGIEDEPMLRGIHVALNPEDVEALVTHARYLLSQPGSVTLDPFLPAAIEATQDTEPDVARELARLYVERRPNDDAAVRTYLRAAVSTAERPEIIEALMAHVGPDTTQIDLLWWRSAAAASQGYPDWVTWLEQAVLQIRLNPETYGKARAAVEKSARFVPDDVRYLGAAVLALAAGQWDAAQAELDDWYIVSGDQADPVGAFVAACARVEAIEYLGLPELVPALDALIDAAFAPGTEALAGDTELFSMNVAPAELMSRYRIALGAHDMLAHGLSFLQSLRDRRPDRVFVREALAELFLESNRLNDGIRELRAVAQIHERAGDLTAMVEAMRKISQAVPNNLEIKQMLVDVYMRRGILDEALRELERVAILHLDVGDVERAIAAYSRAAEIACAMGNLSRGNELYDRGVAADPDNVPVRHAAVAFYLQTGSVDRAAEHLREIVRIALTEQDPDEAVAALHQIIGLAPDDINAYHKLGEVLTSMGEYKQAERVYRRLGQFAPHDPVLLAKQSALAVLAATG